MSGRQDGDRSMHVAVVTGHPARIGGMEKFSRFLVGSLLAAGWRVTVALSGEDIFDESVCGDCCDSPRRHGGTEKRETKVDLDALPMATVWGGKAIHGSASGTLQSISRSSDSGGLEVERVEWLDGTCAGDRRYERRVIADRRRWFRRVRPDAAVFVQSSNTPLRAAIAGAALAGVPLVTTHRTMPWPVEDVPSSRHFGGLVPGLHLHRRRVVFKTWLTAGLARAIVYNSHQVRREYEEQYGYPRGKGMVIANAVDVPAESAGAADGGSKEGVVTIGYVGRISREKRLDVLMRAAAEVRTTRPVRLVFYGEGPEQPKLAGLAEEVGIAGRVTWAGPTRDVWAAYGECDVVVLCSPRESSSNMVLEAMAAGRAVVVSAVGGLPELVDEGRAGICVPALDVGALAAAMGRLVEDGDLRRELGACGRRLARERHHPARIARQWQDLLLRVCGHGRQPVRWMAADDGEGAVAAAGSVWA